MTRRRRAVLAAATVLVAFALASLSHHDRVAPSAPVTDYPQPLQARDQITTVAGIAATRALACRSTRLTAPGPTRAPQRWCGQLTVTRRQTACTSATRCEVELIGALTSPDVSTVIAMTVEVQRNDSGTWRVVAVSS